MGIMDITEVIDPQRAQLAADLYNRAYTTLTENGWTEARDVESGKGWWWRNPNHEHQGLVAMDAALAHVYYQRERERVASKVP